MAKLVSSALAAIVLALTLASGAQAGPASETRRETIAGRQHDYWLSNGLNRLAFWQSGPARHEQTQRP